ncbi:filamentous hemagglutinin N-terminal domain-containing protein [Aquabacterium sp. A7-Y]|nr:filamentous hemagglutinin N-terminal domain-containing protein [Aquabacterium sp. A7-Y]MCW7537319.1 filamentous hemagglutinin N-terminal domain-containing protein [Aquabacterium sp. A7-Y]
MTARMSFTKVPRLSASAAGVVPGPIAARAARRFPIQPLAAALALGFASGSLQALPQGAQVVHGQAQMNQQGKHLQINNTPGAIIHWQSFGIDRGQSVYFQQQGASSSVLNRVTGGKASEILGHLGSNGKVFLVNSAGIVFGRGAVIDTAGFTASTLNISDADWKAGKVRLQAEGVPGGIAITGVVQAHGDVYLIAPQISNEGALKVENGQAILAAGQSVSITGRGLEGVQLEVANAGDTVLNLGSVEAGAVGLFAGTLKHRGSAQANALEVVDGKVWLKARHSAEVSGSASARRGEQGGQIIVTGARTEVQDGAVLDASGARGGGEVLVGGGWQGRDARVENAQATRFRRGATIKADATEVGDGGTVVVWSDGHTVSRGAISARGGAGGGQGGRVETSGKTLTRSGVPDVSAPRGPGGTWLLDPEAVVIHAGPLPSSTSTSVGGDGELLADEAPGQTTAVYESEIESFGQLGGTVRIEATRAITGEGWAAGDTLQLLQGVSLHLETKDATCAGGLACGIDLLSNGPSTIHTETYVSGSQFVLGGLSFVAGSDKSVSSGAQASTLRLGNLDSAGGTVRLQAHGSIQAGNVSAGEFIPQLGRELPGQVQVSTSTADGHVNLGQVEGNVSGTVGGDLRFSVSSEVESGLGAIEPPSGSGSTVVRGLEVGGTLAVTGDFGSALALRGAVRSKEAVLTGLGGFRLDPAGQGALTADKVSFVGNGVDSIVLHGAAHAGVPDGGEFSPSGLILNSDELAVITAGTLRIDTRGAGGEGGPASITIEGSSTSSVVDLAGEGRIGRVELLSSGDIRTVQSSDGEGALVADELHMEAAKIELFNGQNRLGRVSFATESLGSTSSLDGSVSIASATGVHIKGGAAIAPVEGDSGGGWINVDGGGGDVIVDGVLTGSTVNLTGRNIVNGSSGTGRIVARRADVNGPNVRLQAQANVGATAAGQLLTVQLASDADGQVQLTTIGGGEFGIRIDGDARTGHFSFTPEGSASTFSRGVIVASGELSADAWMTGYESLRLQSEGGSLRVASGTQLQAGDLALQAGEDLLIGSPAPTEQPARESAAAVPTSATGVTGDNSLSLVAGDELRIEGGEVATHVEGGDITINAASMTLRGGAGPGAYAAIRYGNALTVNMPAGGGAVRFERGSGSDADAVVYPFASQNAPVLNNVDCDASCDRDFGDADPLNNGTINIGFGAVPLAPPPPPPSGAVEPDIPVLQVLVQLQRVLETERFGKVAVEAENVCR